MQTNLFPDMERSPIVNVASVPHRSPFRYPGGKTWLIPRIRQWLSSFPTKPIESIEPFAGGGIVSLTVAFEELANSVIMVERDEQVAAVWEAILNGDGEWLANRILAFDMTLENVRSELARSNLSREEKAFQTILKNRVNRGGILASGSGMLKHGENGKGIKSRWYPATLSQRILDIVKIRDRICFIEGDGVFVLKENAHRTDVAFFIDPPYTASGKKAGRRLYTYNDIGCEELFRITATLKGDFIMTYNNTEEIKALALRYGFAMQAVAMKNTHHAEMTELIIGRNLDWIGRNV